MHCTLTLNLASSDFNLTINDIEFDDLQRIEILEESANNLSNISELERQEDEDMTRLSQQVLTAGNASQSDSTGINDS